MVLPKEKAEWPLPAYQKQFDAIEQWAVWWEGTSSRLQNFYRPGQETSAHGPRNTLVSRFFGSQKGNTAAGGASQTRIHLPVAGDLFRMSAGLLFSHPPLFAIEADAEAAPNPDGPDVATNEDLDPEADPLLEDQPDGDPLAGGPQPPGVPAGPDAAGVGDDMPAPPDPVQTRIDELLNNDRVAAQLVQQAEQVSALGGGALRVVWDDAVANEPWIECIDADNCYPEFLWGKLMAITFWEEDADGEDVYRHFERYCKVDGESAIQHALYKGTKDNVGKRVPFTDHDMTAWLWPDPAAPDAPDDEGEVGSMEYADADGYVYTGGTRLLAVYVPNRLPYPAWRKSKLLRNIGASDISEDVIPLLAAIDEVWTSLMRDVRQGKGRLVISENLLEVLGRGRGTYFDADSEYLTPVAQSLGEDEKPLVEKLQFEIREGAHLTIITALLKEVLRRVGVSPLTFGIADAPAPTATEVFANTRETIQTTQAKRRLWAPELADIAAALLEVDGLYFDGPGIPDDRNVEVAWPPLVSMSDGDKAQTLQMLEAAKAISTYEKVRYLHDDWTDAQIEEEVERIDSASTPPPLDMPFMGGESSNGNDTGDNGGPGGLNGPDIPGGGASPAGADEAGGNPFAK